MIKKQLWHPDTCGCEIEMTITDGDVTNLVCLKKCERHFNDDTPHTNAYNENVGKNKAHKVLLDEADLAEVDVDESGNKKFKEEPQWHFNANREVVFTVKNKDRVFELDGKVKAVVPKSKVE